jgi:hypothetical protein
MGPKVLLDHNSKHYIPKNRQSNLPTVGCIGDFDLLFFSVSDIFCLSANKFAFVGKSSEFIVDPDN